VTSAEKVERLRRLFVAELARPNADPTLTTLLGAWRMVRWFVRKPLERLLADVDLENSEQLDALLGLIAGAALELRSDELDEGHAIVDVLREEARGLLERLVSEVPG
jgi:hypothetical protein